MTPDDVLAHLPPESDDELTLADDLPAIPIDAFRPQRLRCPTAWARLAPRFLGFLVGRPVDAWCFAGLLFARAEVLPTAFGRIGFLRLPLATDDVEAHARLPAPDASPARAALGVAGLLGLAPVLSEREATALTEPSPLLELTAHPRLLEAWRAPWIRDDELVFFGTPPNGGEVQLVRANLATRWVDLEPARATWRRVLPVRDDDDDPMMITNEFMDPRGFGDATEPLQSEAATDEFADATEPLPRDQLLRAAHAPTVRAPIPDVSDLDEDDRA